MSCVHVSIVGIAVGRMTSLVLGCFCMEYRLMVVFILSSAVLLVGCAQDVPPTQFIDEPRSGSPEVLGNTKLLVCTADGRPTPFYRWTKDDVAWTPSGSGRRAQGNGRQVVEDGSSGTLRIRNVSMSDAGRYRCSAHNSLGALRSLVAVVQVAYISPFASSGVVERQVNAGDAVVLDLPPIDCNPAPSVQWFEGNSQTALRVGYVENYHVTLANQLVVLAARSGIDTKTWRATATNAFTQQTMSGPTFSVRVNNADAAGNVAEVAPLSVVIGPTDTRVVEDVDEAVKFECVVNASPLSYASQRWYRTNDAGQTISLGNDNNKYLLSANRRIITILRPTVADSGLYRCESTYHRPASPPNQDVKISAEARLTVLVKPSLRLTPPAVIDHQVETRLVVPCSAIGTPRPTISWYRNAVLINNTARIYVAENGSLIIPSTSEDDSSVYQCFASSEAGEAYAVIRLRIFGIAPYFISIPQNFTVIVGTTVRLECLANGAPTPAISWTRVRSTPGGIVEAMGSGSELTVSHVAIGDSGVYSCTAINSKGAANGYSYIRVTVKTRIINPLPSSTLAVAGSTVTLPCGVDSDPYHSVTWRWYHNSSLIAESREPGTAAVEQDGSLRLSSVTKADVGRFTCDIDSTGGRDSSSGWLNVIDRPLSPFLISVSLGSETRSVEVIWMADFEDNLYIKKFIVYAQLIATGSSMNIGSSVAVGELLVDQLAPSFSLVVKNLRPSFGYTFSVAAVNDAGEGLPSSTSTALYIPEEVPDGPPRDITASQNSTTTITVCWLSPDENNWNGMLQGYTIRYVEQFQSNIRTFSINFTDAGIQCALVPDLEVGVVYDLSISSYNSAGAGPFSETVKAMIAEGIPVQPASNVTAVAISATRIEVTFLSPFHRARQSTLAYRIYARRVLPKSSESESVQDKTSSVQKRSLAENDGLVVITGSLVGKSVEKVQVGGLRKFTTYQISVVCFTTAGDGPPSKPVIVQTMEDVPEEVGSLTAELLPNSSVIFRWTRPLQTNGILVGYKLYFNIDSDEDSILALPSDVQYFVITVRAAAVCTLQIAAYTRKGDGPMKAISLTAGTTTVEPPTTTVRTTSSPSTTPSTSPSTSLSTSQSTSVLTSPPSSPSTSLYSSPPSSPASPNADKLVAGISVPEMVTSTVSHANFSVVLLSSTVSLPDEPIRDSLVPNGAKTESDDAIYQHWWFVLIMALTGVVLVVSLVVLICWTERRHCRRVKRLEGNSLTSAIDAKTEFQLAPQADENEGFTTIGRRQRWNQSKFPQTGTVPRYTRAPPRPSPASILYDDVDVDVDLHQAMTSFRDDDSGHASDRACQDIDDDDSDVYTRLQTSSLHRQRYLNFPDASVRPRSHYDSTCLTPNVHNTSGVYQTVAFFGDDQSLAPAESSTFRPPVLSSFT